jgi:hypothetical protein
LATSGKPDFLTGYVGQAQELGHGIINDVFLDLIIFNLCH